MIFFILPKKSVKYIQRSLCLGNERTLRETYIMNVCLSCLSTNNLKPINSTLYEKKKYISFFFLFISIGTEMPKSWQYSEKLCGKKKLQKKINFSSFFWTVMYQTLKSMQSHLYGEIKRLLPDTCHLSVFLAC